MERKKKFRGKGSWGSSDDDVKHVATVIKKKRVTNKRSHKYEMSESLRHILPRYFLSLVLPVLNDLVSQLHKSGSSKEDDNSPLKQALALLTDGQQSISVHVLNKMSPEEQLYYVHMINSLLKSLVGYQGSLETLQSSPVVAMLVNIFLGIALGSREDRSAQVVSHEVSLLVVSAFSSLILEKGVVLIQQPVVMEALESLGINEGLQDILLKYTPMYLAIVSKSKSEVGDSEGESTQVSSGLPQDLDPIFELNSKVEEALYINHDADTGFGYLSFENHLSSRLKKTFKKELRDGYKQTNPQDEVDMGVNTISFTDSDIHLTQSHEPTSIPEPSLLEKSEESLSMKTIKKDIKVSLKNKLHECNSETDIHTSTQLVNLLGEVHVQANPELGNVVNCVEVREVKPVQTDVTLVAYKIPALNSSCTQSDDICSPPLSDPSMSWCWKKRLESQSVPAVQNYIKCSSLNALTELDTDCHETICHAIVSEITAPSSFTLIHALHERSQCFFSKCDMNGDTPLHIAAGLGDLVVVKELVDLYPAAVLVQNNKHATPLDIAMDLNHHEVVECLLRGVVQHVPYSTTSVQLLQSFFIKVMKRGCTKSLQLLLLLNSEYSLTIDFECTDGDRHTAWYYLAQKQQDVQNNVVNTLKNSPEPTRSLLCNLCIKNEVTPLHIAAGLGDLVVVKQLVDIHPAAVHILNNKHATPVDIAIHLKHSQKKMVECLIREIVQHDPHSATNIQPLQLINCLECSVTENEDECSEASQSQKVPAQISVNQSASCLYVTPKGAYASKDGSTKSLCWVDMPQAEFHKLKTNQNRSSFITEEKALKMQRNNNLSPSVSDPLKRKCVLGDSSTEESVTKRQPLLFKQHYTDSMASSVSYSTPRKCSVSTNRLKQRARAKERVIKYRFSESDTSDDKKIHCRKRPKAVQRNIKSKSQSENGSSHSSSESSDDNETDMQTPPYQSQLQHKPDNHKDQLQCAAELLHAKNYEQIPSLAYEGQPPMSFPPDMRIPYIFITGLAYYKMSNYKKSVQYFQKCLEMAEECHRDGDVTICNIYIGDIDFSKRKYTDAAGRYQSALYHYSRDSVAKDFRMILPTKSAVWLKCGSAFKNASRMGDAVTAYEKAVELASSKNDQLSAHTSLGKLFQGIGENGRAMKEYEAAIVLATELEDNISLGWNHGNLGNALLGLHQRDKALYHLFKALDMAVVHEMTPQAIGRAYNNLGTAFQSLNELSKAEEQYDLALAQDIYGNDIAGQARVYGNIGNLQMLSKQYDRAVPHYTEVMRLSQDKATITTAHHNRGCAYYDWAEKKKKAFFARTISSNSSTHSGALESPRNKIKSLNVDSAVVPLGSQRDSASEDTSVMNHSPGFKVSLHGPDFKRCEEIYRPMFVPEGVQKYYLQGTRDLDYVIRHHEENFSGIKGSPKGLSLSVSLFESNSRTFHRMQDCLVHLQKSDDQPSRFEDALLVAEQSRARTLEDLLLKQSDPQLEHQLPTCANLGKLPHATKEAEKVLIYPEEIDRNAMLTKNRRCVKKMKSKKPKRKRRKKHKRKNTRMLCNELHGDSSETVMCINTVHKDMNSVTSSDKSTQTSVTSSDKSTQTSVTSSDKSIQTSVTSSDKSIQTSVTSSDKSIQTSVTSSTQTSVTSLDKSIQTSVTSSDGSTHTSVTSSDKSIQTSVTSSTQTFPEAQEASSSDSDCNNNAAIDTEPQQCSSLHTNSLLVGPPKTLIMCQHCDYTNHLRSTSQTSILISLCFSREKFHLKVFSPKSTANYKFENDIDRHISEVLSTLQREALQKVILVIDHQTNLLAPTFISMLQEQWIDSFYFQVIIFPPKVTEPGISSVCHVPRPTNNCVVGDPTNDLPHATREAEHIAHVLKCHPILHGDATKDCVLKKVEAAEIIHLATHAGDNKVHLAITCDGISTVLTPSDIKDIHQKPVLVVLSCCNSAKTKDTANEIQSIAIAFLQAGAQAVIATTSTVSDDSSRVFMQFFYQYLIIDGIEGTKAMHKAMQCMRSFSEFSDPSCWSCYQYYGKNIQFPKQKSSQIALHIGASSVFPRLEILMELKTALISNTRLPTNIQVLHGVEPSEPLIDFIHCNHLYFTGGIFWINCRNPQLIEASLTSITKILGDFDNLETISQQSLFILDSPPCVQQLGNQLRHLLRGKQNIHIVVLISNKCVDLESFSIQITRQIQRGTSKIHVPALPKCDAKMRIVSALLCSRDSIPDKLQELINDCIDSDPGVVDVLCAILKVPGLVENEVEANIIYSVKQRIIFNVLTPSDIQILQHIIVQRSGMPISMQDALKTIEFVTEGSDLSPIEIYNKLKAMNTLLPLPHPIVYLPTPDKQQYTNQHIDEYVVIKEFLRDYLIADICRKPNGFEGLQYKSMPNVSLCSSH